MSMRAPVACLLALATLFAVPAVAVGQAAGEGEPSKKIAADEFAKGKQLFAAGEYLQAAEAFTKAYEAAPHQAVLANIALCYDKAGRFPEAVTYYRRYIADPVQKGKNAEIRQRLQQLKNEIGELRESIMERADAGTVVRVRLRAEKAGDESPPAAPVVPAAGDGAAEAPTERDVSLGVPFWIASGVTVAAGATTVAFGVLTLQARDDYEASGYTDAALKETGERDRLITNIMIGVTAAAAVTAAALAIHDIFFADGEEPTEGGAEPGERSEVAIVPVPGPGLGIGVAGAF